MLISRMWSDEVERIGKQRCTPVGYALHGTGQLFGCFALLLLLAPFVIGLLGEGVLAMSWLLARRESVINLQRGGALVFVLALMWFHHVWTPTAWIYLGLHGSYCLI